MGVKNLVQYTIKNKRKFFLWDNRSNTNNIFCFDPKMFSWPKNKIS